VSPLKNIVQTNNTRATAKIKRNPLVTYDFELEASIVDTI